MKISEQPGQLVIDNSLAMGVATGIILVLGGATVGYLGWLNHIQWLYLLALALVLIGVLVALFARATHVVLVKSGDSTLSSRRLFSAATSQSFCLTDAISVGLVTSTSQRASRDADGSVRTDTQVSSTIYLHLRDGTRIALGSRTRSMNLGGMVGALVQSMPLKKEAERIAAFAGVPLAAHDAVSLGVARPT